MAVLYPQGVPLDSANETLQEFATPRPAIATTHSENATVSSVITLNDNTAFVEIHAAGTGAVAKWITVGNTNPSVISAAGTANFDIAIPQNYYRRLAVPQETAGVSSIVGFNKRAGLYNRLAYKSVGIGSVLTMQY